MNGGGNWLFGLLIVAALATQYPTAAVIIAGLFLLEFLVRWGYRRVWAAQTPFKFADPIEQGLRRGSQALALMLLEPLVAFQFYNGSYGAFPNSADILARPTDYWPLLVSRVLRLSARFASTRVRRWCSARGIPPRGSRALCVSPPASRRLSCWCGSISPRRSIRLLAA